MEHKNHYHSNHKQNRQGQSGVQKEQGYKKPDTSLNSKPSVKDEETGKKLFFDAIEDTLKELELLVDKDFMETGRDLAVLFRAMCTAAAKLPTMELTTEMLCVHNDETGLAVFFDRAAAEGKKDEDDEYDEDFDDFDPRDFGINFDDFDDDDEEEGLLYDGD